MPARAKLRVRPKECCRKSVADGPSSLSARHNDRHSHRSLHASESRVIRAERAYVENLPRGRASAGSASSYESFAGGPLRSLCLSTANVRDARSSQSLRAQSRSASWSVSEWRVPCDSQNVMCTCVRNFERLRSYRPPQHFVTTKIKLRPSREVRFLSLDREFTDGSRRQPFQELCGLRHLQPALQIVAFPFPKAFIFTEVEPIRHLAAGHQRMRSEDRFQAECRLGRVRRKLLASSSS